MHSARNGPVLGAAAAAVPVVVVDAADFDAGLDSGATTLMAATADGAMGTVGVEDWVGVITELESSGTFGVCDI